MNNSDAHDIINFDDLRCALDIINKNKEWCRHEATVQVSEYIWHCDCGIHSFAKAPPEMRKWYDEITKEAKLIPCTTEEVFGIKLVRSDKDDLEWD